MVLGHALWKREVVSTFSRRCGRVPGELSSVLWGGGGIIGAGEPSLYKSKKTNAGEQRKRRKGIVRGGVGWGGRVGGGSGSGAAAESKGGVKVRSVRAAWTKIRKNRLSFFSKKGSGNRMNWKGTRSHRTFGIGPTQAIGNSRQRSTKCGGD